MPLEAVTIKDLEAVKGQKDGLVGPHIQALLGLNKLISNAVEA